VGGYLPSPGLFVGVETVLEDWPEASYREREWLSVEQAVKRVEEAKLKQILMSFPNTLLINPHNRLPNNLSTLGSGQSDRLIYIAILFEL
jgi:hypothetical protein